MVQSFVYGRSYMLKLRHLIISTALFSAVCMPVVAEETLEEIVGQSYAFSPFTGEIVGSKVRLRTQPSLEGHVVRETREGELFAITGDEGDFYAVTPPSGTKGYVFRTFVLDGRVEGERVNVRLYPDIEAPVVARLNTGDNVNAHPSDINPKWLEVDLPETSHFFVAKEFVQNKGPVELVAQMEKRHHEATHLLSAVFLHAQSEIQKALPQIDFESIQDRFKEVTQSYQDFPDVVERVEEASHLIKELYLQKKIAFLESKASNTPCLVEFNQEHVDRLAELGIHIHRTNEKLSASQIAHAASQVSGISSIVNDESITDKMMAWEPVEQALYHLWAASNHVDSMDEFYSQQEEQALFLSGIVEAYNRPVKNLPGDYILKHKGRPAAFLYSTHVNLSELVGKNVTIRAVTRPNNHFAYPAYFVLSAE